MCFVTAHRLFDVWTMAKTKVIACISELGALNTCSSAICGELDSVAYGTRVDKLLADLDLSPIIVYVNVPFSADIDIQDLVSAGLVW